MKNSLETKHAVLRSSQCFAHEVRLKLRCLWLSHYMLLLHEAMHSYLGQTPLKDSTLLKQLCREKKATSPVSLPACLCNAEDFEPRRRKMNHVAFKKNQTSNAKLPEKSTLSSILPGQRCRRGNGKQPNTKLVVADS